MQRRGKILIVDDEPEALEIMQDILRSEGYQTVAVSSAAAALESLAEDNFDILLTDMRMPGMSGLELVEKLQETSPKTAPILITAYCNLELAKKAIQLGAYDISKPITRNGLRDAICSVLARRELAAEMS
jgi:DNA-binding NtrC family response regulator